MLTLPYRQKRRLNFSLAGISYTYCLETERWPPLGSRHSRTGEASLSLLLLYFSSSQYHTIIHLVFSRHLRQEEQIAITFVAQYWNCQFNQQRLFALRQINIWIKIRIKESRKLRRLRRFFSISYNYIQNVFATYQVSSVWCCRYTLLYASHNKVYSY